MDLSWRGLLIKALSLGNFLSFKWRRVFKSGLFKNTAAGRIISFKNQ